MIIPIGAQNAYVLNQGFKRHHHLTTAATCGVLDMILSRWGFWRWCSHLAKYQLVNWCHFAWNSFLCGYGFLSLRAALNPPKNLNPRQIRWLQDVKRSFWCLCGHCV